MVDVKPGNLLFANDNFYMTDFDPTFTHLVSDTVLTVHDRAFLMRLLLCVQVRMAFSVGSATGVQPAKQAYHDIFCAKMKDEIEAHWVRNAFGNGMRALMDAKVGYDLHNDWKLQVGWEMAKVVWVINSYISQNRLTNPVFLRFNSLKGEPMLKCLLDYALNPYGAVR